jgi:cysteine synthase A
MPRGKSFENINQTIGESPMVKLNRVIPAKHATVFAKCEFFNPLNSVKDRIGVAMIEDAECRGVLKPDTHIVEPTSGNTGIALAFVCAAKGYKLTLTMPESMSLERRALLRAMGSNLVLTPAADGMRGALEKATEIVANGGKNAWMPQQFENPANPKIHEETTGPEIWEDSGHNIDAIVTGVGTGGTITGVGRYIRRFNPNFRIIVVEPIHSPVITQTRNGEPLKPGSHKIQGIGANFVPKNLDLSLVEEVLLVSNDQAIEWSRRLMKEEGIMAGISSGANVWAAAQVAARPEFQGKRIVTMLPSLGERYLTTALFDGLTG